MPSAAKVAEERLLDMGDIRCPDLLVEVARDIRTGGAGIYHIVARDSTTAHDIPRFCKFSRYTLLDSCVDTVARFPAFVGEASPAEKTVHEKCFHYWIEKH